MASLSYQPESPACPEPPPVQLEPHRFLEPLPRRIITDGRTASIGYAAGQPSTMVKVFCTDGGTFTMRVAPPGPAPGAPDPPGTGQDENVWEDEGGGLGPLRNRTVR